MSNTQQKIIYILQEITYNDSKDYCLIRAFYSKNSVDYGEEYYEGEWHPFDGIFSYFPDPTPGEFIIEEKAKEIMKIIDKEEEMLDKEE